jgi:hypothetical protein
MADKLHFPLQNYHQTLGQQPLHPMEIQNLFHHLMIPQPHRVAETNNRFHCKVYI